MMKFLVKDQRGTKDSCRHDFSSILKIQNDIDIENLYDYANPKYDKVMPVFLCQCWKFWSKTPNLGCYHTYTKNVGRKPRSELSMGMRLGQDKMLPLDSSMSQASHEWVTIKESLHHSCMRKVVVHRLKLLHHILHSMKLRGIMQWPKVDLGS